MIDYFGMIKLTYGFCSHELARQVSGRIAPELDQHASYEKNRLGNPICSRLGAAVDFLIEDEDMIEVANWIIGNLAFDRLYIYESDRPLHVSFGPANSRRTYRMTMRASGARIPRLYHVGSR